MVMHMTITTRVYNTNQTTIPSKIRKKFNIKPDDVVKWEELEDGVKITFEKKISIYDVTGIIKGDPKNPTNAVDLKKKMSRGEKV